MPSNIHPSLAEMDRMLADPEEQPGPPLPRVSWADYWEKILAANRPGFIELYLFKDDAMCTVWELVDGRTIHYAETDGSYSGIREALARFASRLDGGLPRGTVAASAGSPRERKTFILHRRGKVWFATAICAEGVRSTQRCRSFRRGLIALEHWAANNELCWSFSLVALRQSSDARALPDALSAAIAVARASG